MTAWRPSKIALKFSAAYATASCLYLFFTLNVLNTPVYTGSDAGVFNAMFYQMSLGRKLYRDVFDIKDPLFFHGYAFFRQLLGIAGPMTWETILTLLTIGVLFRIAWRAGLSAGMSLFAVMAYLVFYFNPNIYQPIHTYHQSLFLLLLGFALAVEDRPLPAGVSVALALWSKATLAAFLPAIAVAVALPICRRQPAGALPRLFRFTAACGVTGSLVAVLLAMSGEFRGYVDVVKANFGYTAIISAALGWHNDPFGRTREILGLPMLMIFTVATVTISAGGVLILYRVARSARRDEGTGASSNLGLIGVAVGCLAGAGLILFQAAWFNHYFASLAPGAFFATVALACLLRRLPFSRLAAVGSWIGTCVLLAGALMTGFFPTSGLSYRAPSCPFPPDSDVQDPDFVRCLRTITFAPARTRTFAVVGPNANDTPVASMPADFIVGCRLFFQFPWNGQRMLDEFATCVARDVDVVIAEDLLHFERPPHKAMARRIDSAVQRHFNLVGQCGRFRIWERKTLRASKETLPTAAGRKRSTALALLPALGGGSGNRTSGG